MRIENIGAIVTGGASGLGGAVAQMLAAEGAKVTIFDLSADQGAAVAESVGGLFVKTDVSDDEGVATAMDLAEAAHGVSRILVNCAGISPAARIVDKTGVPMRSPFFARR